MDYRQRAAELYHDCARPSASVQDALSQALSAAEPLVRHVAAIELAKLNPELLSEQSIREMLETLAKLEYLERLPIEDEYAEATATEEDSKCLGQEIAIALASLRCGQANFVIPRLLEFWSFDCQFYELAHAMLALAFPVTDSVVEKVELSGVQIRILQALVNESSQIWGSDYYWPDALSKHGLPRSRKDVCALLEYVRD